MSYLSDFAQRYPKIFITIVVLATSLPFLNKPYHVDDTFVLHETRSILQNPWNPFSGEIDWFGYQQPVWEATTNPPFLSYYLAPFAVFTDYSEVVLHASMMVFVFLLGGGMWYLTRRFAQGDWMPFLFTMTSCAVIVSGNVMRDVPAAGMMTAAIACYIAGTDREDRRLLIIGSLLAGLALMTKYSSVITIPVLALYPFIKRKYRLVFWIWPVLAILLLWCIHNVLVFGKIHIVYLFLERRSVSGISWMDKLCGALVITGSILYLFPALYREGIQRKDHWMYLGCPITAGLAVWGVRAFLQEKSDWQVLFWTFWGTMLLFACLLEGIRRGLSFLKTWSGEEAGDTLFLIGWLSATVLFSIFLVPFQAVRHLITALPPMTLLAMRYMQREPIPCRRTQKMWLTVLLLIQIGASFIIQWIDYAYADTYRNFAAYAKEKYFSNQHKTWFIGQWGWMFYAEKAGFPQLHGKQLEAAQEGDFLLQPKFVHVGLVFDGRQDFIDRLQLVEEIKYPAPIPLGTMNWSRGACFYAVITKAASSLANIPYRFLENYDLEIGQVYQIGPPRPPEEVSITDNK